ncbi:hypothetical protein ACHAWF_011477 [Thalassiosira exigua]
MLLLKLILEHMLEELGAQPAPRDKVKGGSSPPTLVEEVDHGRTALHGHQAQIFLFVAYAAAIYLIFDAIWHRPLYGYMMILALVTIWSPAAIALPVLWLVGLIRYAGDDQVLDRKLQRAIEDEEETLACGFDWFWK